MIQTTCDRQIAADAGRRDRPTAAGVWDVAATVCDPELPVLTIEDLGVLREASVVDGVAHVVDHADLLRVPGDRRDGHRCEDRAGGGGLSGCRRDDGARAGLDHATGCPRPASASSRNSGSRPPSASGRCLPDPGAIAVPCPQCGSRNTRGGVRVRSTRLQGALRLPATAGSRSTTSRCTDVAVRDRRPSAQTGRFHPLTVRGGAPAHRGRRSRSPSPCPTELADEYDYEPGQYLALRTELDGQGHAPQLLDLRGRRCRGSCASRSSATSAACSPAGRNESLQAGRRARGDEPAGHASPPTSTRPRTQALRRDRRRIGHHADHGAHRAASCSTAPHASSACSTRTAPRWT